MYDFFTKENIILHIGFIVIDCGDLTAPEDGQVTFTPGVVMTLETGLDAVANYTCNVGYDLVGETLRTCQANEEWTGTEPNCMRK